MRLAPWPCMLCPTNIFTSSPSSTPCDRRQQSKILFRNYFNLTSTEKVQSCKYIQILADPFSVLPKPFHVGGSTLRKLSHHAESSTTFNYFTQRSQVCKNKNKISFRNSFPHYTPKLGAWTSLEGAFVERGNSWPITSWHVTLPSPQDTANYKAPHIVARFCYHYLETNRNLPSVMQEPITPQHV